MDTVLGLSMTSTSIGWVLLDGPHADASTLDHDAFDLGAGPADDGDICRHMAAVRGAQSIAASSGHQVKSIGVTWTDDADDDAALLLKALPDLGFDEIVRVKPSEATRTWARAFGRELEFEKCAVCVVESKVVTTLSYGYDSVRTFTTPMRESADGLSRWLNETFETNKLRPDTLFLVGSRGDVELIAGPLSGALPMTVDASEDAQLALARGAALKVSTTAAASDDPAGDTPADQKPTRRWPRLRHHPPLPAAADDLQAWTEVLKKSEPKEVDGGPATQYQTATDIADSPLATENESIASTPEVVEPTSLIDFKTVVGETAGDVVEPKTEVIDDEPVTDKPAERRSWYGPHGRAATVLAAGVIAVFVVVPMLTGSRETTPAETAPASETSDGATTSVSVHAVPGPMPALPPPAAVQPVAAPAPPPPPAIAPPAIPVAEPTQAPVTAEPMVATQAPAIAPEPAAAAAPEAAQTEPVAPEAPVTPQPLVAPQAPVVLPAEAPQPLLLAPPAVAAPPPAGAPPAAPPPPAGAPAPAPPPDPVMAVLSPFFGALP